MKILRNYWFYWGVI